MGDTNYQPAPWNSQAGRQGHLLAALSLEGVYGIAAAEGIPVSHKVAREAYDRGAAGVRTYPETWRPAGVNIFHLG